MKISFSTFSKTRFQKYYIKDVFNSKKGMLNSFLQYTVSIGRAMRVFSSSDTFFLTPIERRIQGYTGTFTVLGDDPGSADTHNALSANPTAPSAPCQSFLHGTSAIARASSIRHKVCSGTT